jgi:hypothetical protein
MSEKESSAADTQAQLRVVREFVGQDVIMNRRLGWLIQMQGFLFLALAFAWNTAPWALTILLSALGIGTALSLRPTATFHDSEVQRLREWWDNHLPDGPNVGGLWSPPSGIRAYFWPSKALPMIFVAAWIAVLIISVFGNGAVSPT